ncbi:MULTISPECIES: TerC family protein [Cupriavidus]|uniref:TerC family protein n=1 Tax=Cupriavidus pauculus TaxID=82633 RepID=A0A3G8GX06_9BURK|nr:MULTISPECIES: TerC family protein [Cupriavidus]AZG12490.1 TerC family protein [Cupriavidus pauculus]MDT6962594.1 TerC family protein [Cupriavidus sp. SZY C1]
MELLSSSTFWIALGSIILTNIVLSGDNAVVIALASRNLPPAQQKKAIFWGSAAAIIMRVVLTVAAVKLLSLPYLKIVGAILLVYIGVQLLTGDDGEEGHDAKDNIWAAIRTILIADLVMSLDNVVAVAAAAQKGPEGSQLMLLIIGLGLSIPLIVFGSTLLLKVMERFPIIIVLGAALLGYLAGEMLISDPVDAEWFQVHVPHAHLIFGIAGAALVVLVGKLLQKRGAAKTA